MSLRARLVLIVSALLALGLVAAAVATFAAVHDYLADRADERLTNAAHQVESIHRLRPDLGDGAPDRLDDAALWALVTGADFPFFFQVRDSRGAVLSSFSTEPAPVVPAEFGLAPGGAPAFYKINGEPGGPNYRVRVSSLPDTSDVLVLGTRTTDFDGMVRRLAGVEAVVTSAVLAAVGLLAWLSIRRAMRPLSVIADTAREIGDGDLTRRVASTRPRTEVGRLGAALDAMLGQIESAFRQRADSEARLRRFVSDASHELRTPIATIRGYAELFRRGAAARPDDLAMAMTRIESEAERMGVLVDELLLLASLDQGRALTHEPVDLAALAADAVADARAVEPARELTRSGVDTLVVTGDEDRLRQALGNLLANVRRHTPPTAPAEVRLTRNDRWATVTVADSGPGLTAEQRARVFERFYRTDQTRARDNGGAGLGLSIVAAIATAHGGDTAVHSEPGRGATFTLRLPLTSHPATDTAGSLGPP